MLIEWSNSNKRKTNVERKQAAQMKRKEDATLDAERKKTCNIIEQPLSRCLAKVSNITGVYLKSISGDQIQQNV